MPTWTATIEPTEEPTTTPTQAATATATERSTETATPTATATPGNGSPVDDDGDGVADEIDNCPHIVNPDQADQNGNGVGDYCDPDAALTTGALWILAFENGEPISFPANRIWFDLFAATDDDSRGQWLATTFPGYVYGPGGWLSPLPPGRYVLANTGNDNGLGLVADRVVTIAAGEVTTVAIETFPTGLIEVHAVDGQGQPVPGACFEASWPGHVIAGCDGTHTGVIVLPWISQGDILLRETAAPAGYSRVADRSIFVAGGQVAQLDVVHEKRGVLTVRVVNALTQEPVPNAWVDIFSHAPGQSDAHIASIADGAQFDLDGIANGELVTDLVDPGEVLIRPTLPTPGWQDSGDLAILMTREDQTVTLAVTPPGAVTVTASDGNGVPVVPVACFFWLFTDIGGGEPGQLAPLPWTCDDSAETKTFAFVPAGDYVLVELGDWPGFRHAPNRPVTVSPGADITIAVVLDPA
ncbi:hypothetical protein KF840_18980 [bacterium]|nr:hypothetical protein [bacterium]